ncbi:MAG: LytTR family DNA-binding domain-containing protein [Pseudomonadota bacterium]
MRKVFTRYFGAPLSVRLATGVSAVILLNAFYCLAYRYAKGNPATLFEAFSWGAIHLAPWVAAFDIGRTNRSWSALVAIFAAAFAISLALDIAAHPGWPTSFDVIKRLPGALLAAAAIAAFRLYRSQAPAPQPELTIPTMADRPCDWARSAGNYVELYRAEEPMQLVRSTLAQLVRDKRLELVRIHRQHAVHLGAVTRIEASHVVLTGGARLPIGSRYRANLPSTGAFVPSSHNA